METKKYKVLESFEMTDGKMSEVGAILELQDHQAEALGSMVELVVEHQVGDPCERDGKQGTWQTNPDEGWVCVLEPEPPTPPTGNPPASTPSMGSAKPPVEAKPWAGNHKVPG